jgi:hypothetical protein
MKLKKIIQDKNGLSEMVSYVLLIVIAIGLSTGVYAWLKGYLPSVEPKETCNSEVALVLEDYNCNSTINKTTIKIRNQGFFNIDGFFIKGGNSSDEKVLPIVGLKCDSPNNCLIKGKYDFINSETLKPQDSKEISFYYTEVKPLLRIQIQPYVKPSKPNQKNSLLLCEKIIDLNLEGCN